LKTKSNVFVSSVGFRGGVKASSFIRDWWKSTTTFSEETSRFSGKEKWKRRNPARSNSSFADNSGGEISMDDKY